MSVVTKFTRGPWVSIPSPFRDRFDSSKPIFKNGMFDILPEYNTERLPICRIDKGDDHDASTRAAAIHDANLIAAAPVLYEALEKMTAWAGGMDAHRLHAPWPEMVEKARAALAKARGEA